MAPQVLRRLSAPEHVRLRDGVLYDLGRQEVIFAGDLLSDIGDIKYRPHQTDEDYLEFVANAVAVVARAGKRPLVLGGDHLVTLAALRGLAAAGRSFQVLQFDAHHDYDPIQAGERPTHASFISFVAAEGLAKQVLQLGIRGLAGRVQEVPTGVRMITLAELGSVLMGNVDVYLTIDTDAFDPVAAPAVGYAEPDGLPFAALDCAIETLRVANLPLVGADWTEYNPSFEPANNITGRTIITRLARVIQCLLR